MVKPMPIPPPAARMVATTVPTATQRPHIGRGAGDGGMYCGGGANQPSGAGGGAGTCCSCETSSVDCGSISDIGSTPFCTRYVDHHDAGRLFEEYQRILRVP